MQSDENKSLEDGYDVPVLGPPTSVALVTLFSGTINPDAGVVNFGDG